MTLVEKLQSFEGESGEYRWVVEVWRSDTTAVANLRVRLIVYRIERHPWPFADDYRSVFSETEVASESTVAERMEDAREKGRRLVDRFDSEREAVEEVMADG